MMEPFAYTTRENGRKWIALLDEEALCRGGIEGFGKFVDRNLQWWKQNHHHEKHSRRPYYDSFLDFCDARQYLADGVSLAEVGPGPFGGLIEVCGLPSSNKTFIDYIMWGLVQLNYIRWPKGTYVHSGAEKIPLPSNSIDVLFSYNCLDHGWDWKRAVAECIRISKRCFLAFDCRGDLASEVKKRQTMMDVDHFQLIRFSEVETFLQGDALLEKIDDQDRWVRVRDLGTKDWPVAVISVE